MFKVLKYNFKAAEFLAAGMLLDKSAYCVFFFFFLTFVFCLCSFVDNNENADILIVLLNWGFVFFVDPPLSRSHVKSSLHLKPEDFQSARNFISPFLGSQCQTVCLTYLVLYKDV